MKKWLNSMLVAAMVLGMALPAQAQQPLPSRAPLAKPPATAPQPVQQAPAAIKVSPPIAATQTSEHIVAKQALAAVAQAVSTWQQQARLKGQVQADKLTTAPGGLTGPPLAPLIKTLLTGQGVAPGTADKFAMVFGDAWQKWQTSFMVPEITAYPAFIAWPAPAAPPTPNVPFPLAAGVSAQTAALSEPVLRSALLAQFPGATPQQKQAIEAFAKAAATNVYLWRAATQVTNVLGSGPVPTFVPVHRPFGPVVGGTATMMSPGFVGPPFSVTGIP